jgi:hypothetical protein
MTQTIVYTGWIREGSYGDADDIIYLEDSTYIDSDRDPAYSNFDKFYDGDPVADVLEDSIRNKQVSVCYWITNQKCTKDEAQEEFLKKLYGAADCYFLSHYSGITGYLWTDEDLVIGGHDLLAELRSNVGSFVVLDITVHD